MKNGEITFMLSIMQLAEELKIVIAGGGFGGLYTLKHLSRFFRKEIKQGKIRLILINERNYFLFTPLLHEVATGGLSRENVVEPLRSFLQNKLSDFYLDQVKEVKIQEKKVVLEKYTVDYDFLVLASGSETNFYQIPGASEYCFTLKNLADAVKLKNHLIHTWEKATKIKDLHQFQDLLNFVVVGGGATGVELVCEIADLFQKTLAKFYPALKEKCRIILIERGDELLKQFSPKLRKVAFEVLRKRNIEVKLNIGVVAVDKHFVKLDNGETIHSRTIIWTAGVKPREIKFDLEVKKAKNGRLLVDQYLRLVNHQDIFALGDVCCLDEDGKHLPFLAQVAVKEAKLVAENIFRTIKKQPLKKLKYRHAGDLISLGRWYAIGELNFGKLKLALKGKFAWWLWRTVYLSKMLSFRKKLKTAIDWTFDLFLPRDISEF